MTTGVEGKFLPVSKEEASAWLGWIAGIALLAVLPVIAQVSGAGTWTQPRLVGVGLAATFAVAMPTLQRMRAVPYALEVGWIGVLALLYLTDLRVAGWPGRAVLAAAIAFVVFGYFMFSLQDRFREIQADGGPLDEARRFGAIRIAVITVVAAMAAVILLDIPRLLGYGIGDRWRVSIDAVSVHVYAAVALGAQAVGTGLVLVRLGWVDREDGEATSAGSEPGS